mgnify:CR=1 FL=1
MKSRNRTTGRYEVANRKWDGKKQRSSDKAHTEILVQLASVATSVDNIEKHLEVSNDRLDKVEVRSVENDKSIAIVRTVVLVLFGLAGLGAAVWQAIGG